MCGRDHRPNGSVTNSGGKNFPILGDFSGEYDEAIDMTGLRMMGALRTGGVGVRSYLTSFRLDRAPGAPQAFSVTVQTKPQTQVSDPDGCQEFPPIINEIFPFE